MAESGPAPTADRPQGRLQRPRIRVFSGPASEPRFRRATDVLLLVPALIGLVLLIAAYPPGPLENSLIEFLDSIPGWLDPLWGFSYDLLAAWAIVLVATTVGGRRWLVALESVAAAAVSAALALVCARLALGDWPNVADAIRGGSDAPSFPGMRLAEAAAVVATTSPYLVRPLQRSGRVILALGFVGALVVGGASPSGTLAALLLATTVAAAIRLAFGTSAGRPGLAEVGSALAELGISTHDLEVADRSRNGAFVVRGRDLSDCPLLVKVYGRDAYDSQLLTKLWRTLWYEDAGPGLRLGRSQVAEHEAFVTLLARNGGVSTFEVVTAGTTAGDDALLVLRGEARPFATLPAARLDADVLRSAWRALELLHSSNIAHLRLDPTTVALVGGDVGFLDFAGSTVTATGEQLLTDRAQLLLSTAVAAGSERALAAAVEALGSDGVTSLLPYLQAAALGGPLRQAAKTAGIDIDDFRKHAAAAVGADVPELVRLRRLTWASVVQVALLLLAASAILSFATGIDWDEVGSALTGAAWAWIIVGFAVAQLPRVTQAVATLGSVAVTMRFGPVYAMQLATNYMNLALPSYAARLAVNIRFFQRQGLTPAAAVTSGAIDSFASTVTQVGLLAVLLVFTESSLSIDLSAPSGETSNLLWILLGLLAATLLIVTLVPRIRRSITGRLRTLWPEVRAALGSLRASNKLVLLLLGNLATELLFATALGLFALGLGFHLSITELLVINMAVSLFASFIPVPGGIGVVEFGLTIGLTSAGMPEEAALATALLYRIATFYVPPVWGFFALRWLRRNRYL